MISRIIVSKQAITAFRREAIKAHPNEFLQTLWGRIQGDTVLVHAIRPVEHRATAGSIDLTLQDTMAPAQGTDQFIGTIHSHPDTKDATPSQTEWEDAFSTGEHVFGVMRVMQKPNGKFETELEWWEPRASIQMIYPKVRSTNELRKPKEQKPMPELRVQQIGTQEL
jgi:proteasome lid subunit RPN8/RPN11